MSAVILVSVSLCATVAFVLLELRDPQFRDAWGSDLRRLRRNLSFLAANLVTMAILQLCTRTLERMVPRLWDWGGAHAPLWLAGAEVVACLIVAELINWVSHWLKHRHPWLWRFHLQHHVETRYNVSLTVHTHGLEVVVTGCAMATVLMLCGFSRFAVDAFALVYYVTNLYKHTSAPLSLGGLDRFVVSPHYHRLHHAVGHDGNFGSVLTLFDVVFGTARYPAPGDFEAVRALPLGVATPEPFGFWDEMRAPFVSVPSAHPDPIGTASTAP